MLAWLTNLEVNYNLEAPLTVRLIGGTILTLLRSAACIPLADRYGRYLWLTNWNLIGLLPPHGKITFSVKMMPSKWWLIVILQNFKHPKLFRAFENEALSITISHSSLVDSAVCHYWGLVAVLFGRFCNIATACRYWASWALPNKSGELARFFCSSQPRSTFTSGVTPLWPISVPLGV